MPDSDQVLVRVHDGVGHLTLNRPEALNALSYEMIGVLSRSLETWMTDSEVSVVVIDGAGKRGLCAGGDVRVLYEGARTGRNADSRRFFREEYRLNAMIAEYSKPVVAIMDGITMGGGIGIAGHAAIRVVTERSRLAMPETRIGFCPDVGGTWLLSRSPGELGTYLGLGAATMTAADAIAAGFADYFVPSARLPGLVQALAERADPGSPAEIVLLFDETPAASELESRRRWIDDCFAADSVLEIIAKLKRHGEPEARDAAEELEGLSPTALAVTLAALREVRELSTLRAALELEYRTCSWLIEQPDLVEGIRAQVIDKDRSPRWTPPTLAELPADTAERALRHSLPDSVW
ncbi:3-hydroxyisobutyryl-CoA hydrolase [Glaciibacter superstes]|uniref:3-hydroxyisobutyryl-CoA hydrolase n=1 Tax=Glaciibacter superstes TaxID=501023 RepID=UPI0003B38D7A|nr:3-hydroxyisobutyryl-CoA hydrolase [Glaciibacter superstes]